MTNSKKRKKGINPVMAAVAGAVIGAGMAVAGAVALKDEKNRKKVKAVLANAKDQAMSYVDQAKKKATQKKLQVVKKLSKGKAKLKKIAVAVKKS